MRQKFSYVLAAASALLFLVLFSVVAFVFIFSLRSDTEPQKDKDTVYVYVSAEATDTEEEKEKAFLIREYNEKVGIFDQSGKLVRIIDTYVKTLPNSERAELQEGFWIESDEELYLIIEAYTD